MRNFDKSFFKQIDSEQKAYFLGILMADGYNYSSGNNKYVSLRLQEEDIDVLEKLNNIFNNVYSIKALKQRNSDHKIIYSLQINSKEISNDLSKLGCIQNKSKKLTFPVYIDTELINHFIRGYFDGDGSVWEGKRYVAKFKDGDKYRNRIIHNVKFNITGTESMIEGIQNELIKKDICKKNKINKSKNIENCVQLEYSGRLQMKKFYDFLYKDATIFMNRKKQKFESIVCANI